MRSISHADLSTRPGRSAWPAHRRLCLRRDFTPIAHSAPGFPTLKLGFVCFVVSSFSSWSHRQKAVFHLLSHTARERRQSPVAGCLCRPPSGSRSFRGHLSTAPREQGRPQVAAAGICSPHAGGSWSPDPAGPTQGVRRPRATLPQLAAFSLGEGKNVPTSVTVIYGYPRLYTEPNIGELRRSNTWKHFLGMLRQSSNIV